MDEGLQSSPEGYKGQPESESPELGIRTYVLAWLGIILLTAITFALSHIKVGGWTVVVALLIAGTQSALALYFFMHLRQEKARIFKVIIPLVLSILVVLMALTFSDVAFRG